jgi:hypothetical protein
MNSLYVIVVYLLNASNGELESEYVSSEPVTLEVCAQSLIDRGPVPVKDGQAQFAFCRKLDVKVTT